MRHKRYKFGCDRSIMKGTLLEEQRTFTAVSRLVRVTYLKLHTYYFLIPCVDYTYNLSTYFLQSRAELF